MTDVIAQTLRQLSIESGLVEDPDAIPADILPQVIDDELVAAQEPGLVETLAPVTSAEIIAEQLDELADRADAVAVEDPTVVALSAESLNREFETIMKANHMSLRSHSFESAGSDLDRLKGVSKDARTYAAASRHASQEVLDFSAEGKVIQFLRNDKARLTKAHAALSAGAAKLEQKKTDLADDGVVVHHEGIRRFLVVAGQPVSNAKQAIEHDIAWVKKAMAEVAKAADDVKAAVNSAQGEGEHDAAVSKLKEVTARLGMGLEANLMGNHQVGTNKRTGGEEQSGKKAVISYFVGGFKSIPSALAIGIGGMAVGAVLGGVVGAAGAVAAHVATNVAQNVNLARHVVKDYNKRSDRSDAKSVASAADLRTICNELLSLSDATNFSLDAKVEDAGAKLDSASVEVKTAAKQALAAVSKLADVVYEHAIYLTVRTAQLVTVAADKA